MEQIKQDFSSLETTLRDYLKVLFRNKGVILVCMITVLVTVYVGLKFKTPSYEATVKLLISAEKQVESPYYRQLYDYQNIQKSLTQSEIVKSTPVLERVIQALKLTLKPLDYERKYASPLKHALIDFQVDRMKMKLDKYPRMQQQVIRFQLALKELKEKIKVEPIRDTNIFAISVRDYDPVGAAILANVISRSYIIFDLEQQLAELTSKYGEKNPIVVQLKDNIHGMIQNLNGAPLSNMEAIGPASVKIIEQATVPMKAVGTSKMLVLVLAFIMSIFLGTMLAFIFEYMDQSFKSPVDIERELGLAFLGSVARRRLGERLLIRKVNRKAEYDHFYRLLTDQMYLLINDKKIKTILFTSAEDVEGTEGVVANLGTLLAKRIGRKVLIIDADLRRPRFRKIFKVKKQTGLSDLLEDKAVSKEVIVKAAPKLDVLPAGLTELNPLLLLGSERFKETLEGLRQKYDVILLYCPNAKDVKDPLVLSNMVDASVLIVSESASRRQVVKSIVAKFKERKGQLLGVILNHRTFPIPKFVYDKI